MTEPIVIQFNCPKCRDADWGRGTEWVTVDRDLLARMAEVTATMTSKAVDYPTDDIIAFNDDGNVTFTHDEWAQIKAWDK